MLKCSLYRICRKYTVCFKKTESSSNCKDMKNRKNNIFIEFVVACLNILKIEIFIYMRYCKCQANVNS